MSSAGYTFDVALDDAARDELRRMVTGGTDPVVSIRCPRCEEPIACIVLALRETVCGDVDLDVDPGPWIEHEQAKHR